MRIRNVTLVVSALVMVGFGLQAWGQQKPAATARATSAGQVVVYKSPT